MTEALQPSENISSQHFVFFTYNKFKDGDRSIDRKCSTTGFKIRRGGLTVVQSLQTPPKPQEPSSGEQQGGYKKMSASVIV